MDVILSYYPLKKWFWLQKKTLQPIEPGDSPEDGRSYSYDMIWDGRDPDWIERRKGSKRRIPLQSIKKMEWEADEDDDILPIAVIAIFEYGNELGLY